MEETKYKILIVDDHPIVAEGIKTIALRQENTICQSATCIEKAQDAVYSNRFDLCIIDLELQGPNGFCFIDFLHKHMPECKILIYTMHEEPWVMAKLSKLSINGAVSKNASIHELSEAIEYIRNGNYYYSHEFTDLNKITSSALPHKIQELSPREKEVLAYLSKGLSTSEISDRLFLSVNTIQTYRKRLMEKLEAKNVAELVYKGKGLF